MCVCFWGPNELLASGSGGASARSIICRGAESPGADYEIVGACKARERRDDSIFVVVRRGDFRYLVAALCEPFGQIAAIFVAKFASRQFGPDGDNRAAHAATLEPVLQVGKAGGLRQDDSFHRVDTPEPNIIPGTRGVRAPYFQIAGVLRSE